MTQIVRHVGTDVCSRHLDVSVYPSGERHRFPNTAAGIIDLIAWLKALGDVASAGCEATGGYERGAIEALVAAGFTTRLLNAARVRKFAEALGRAKNDRLDAAVIAHFLAVVPGQPVVVETQRHELRELVGLHRHTSDQLTATSNAARLLRAPAARRIAADGIRQAAKPGRTKPSANPARPDIQSFSSTETRLSFRPDLPPPDPRVQVRQ